MGITWKSSFTYNNRKLVQLPCRFSEFYILVLCCVLSVLSGAQAQLLGPPSGFSFPPPGAALPPPGAALPPPGAALPPGVALPPLAAPPLLDNQVLNEIDNLDKEIRALTRNAALELEKNFSYCITNGEQEWNAVYGFNIKVQRFVQQCVMDMGADGTASQRLCNKGELELYFKNIWDLDSPKPNVNCNSSSWGIECDSGWSAAKQIDSNLHPSSNVVPSRHLFPKACCQGFFCPKGLTCMFPCPLGAFCPRAVLNETTGLCEPYGYQVTQREGNRQCGGAEKWSIVQATQEIFCPAGVFCPSTVDAHICTKGHYCPLGSTREYACSKLTTCRSERLEKQNLTSVGILFVAILAATLLLIFACSDWIMDIRMKSKSRARDLAQRQAATVSASELEGLVPMKESVECEAAILTRKLSNTEFRERPGSNGSEEFQVIEFGLSIFGETPGQLLRHGSMSMRIAEDGSSVGTSIPLCLVPVTLRPRDRIDVESFVEDDAMRSFTELQESQTKIEKEIAAALESMDHKVMNRDEDSETRHNMRPPIEVSFEDLSLFLKGSGKKILSNVTGKLSPGRVTAVMGPSGAGKTTFLNALAGKATHSRTTGVVLINGKPDSIQSYKSIIGFVPQDDIVHGNLTVEENLLFSANYRLPVGMSKRDKVLVVERIISALGLGSIRDSRVGTVENRGISGGQRKRVNVGLEMVMEPSLLILDEPTSGLDSTSSRLVLQALRREANMGVNVGVVLHQPSYGLFRMFDDVMFLAKGGRTVYLGPVSELEAYFESLDLVVPERINPPDHYIDALEGIVNPKNQPGFDPQILPLMWMVNKGYKIPPDLAALASDLQSGTMRGKKFMPVREPKRTCIQDFWTELQVYVCERKDLLLSSFYKVENKSGRTTPGFFSQFLTILRRLSTQRFREARVQFLDYTILLMAGTCLGYLSDMKDTSLGSKGYFYTLIALSLLVMIASLRTFSNDKLTFWRESASGINRVAYFVAKDVVDLFNVTIKPFIYLSMFYFFSNPRSSFLSNFTVTLVLVYCVTGIAYISSILFQPAPAQLWSVFLPIMATLIITVKPHGFLLKLQYLSYARYANEAYVVANAVNYGGVWITTRCAMLKTLNYSVERWMPCLVILVMYGVVARGIALICLFTSNRGRQK